MDDVLKGPFEKGASSKEILKYNWPRPEWFDFTSQLEECESFSDKIIIGGLWSGIFGDSYRMYGYERFLIDILARPATIKTLVDRMTDFYLETNERLFGILGDNLDIFFMGNDFGTQSGLLMDKAVINDLFYENYRKLIDLAHSHKYRVMVHSCGAVSEIIPDFIGLGVDILDPLQTTASGMEPEQLKREFGDRIVFHGGIDTQKILPHADKEKVFEHAMNRIRMLGSNGGYVVAPSNNIPPGSPVENILSIYRAAGSTDAG